MQEFINIIGLIERTENNIKFYLNQNDNMHLLNEIGCLRGLIYAIEEVTQEQYQLTDWEQEIFKLQVSLTDIDKELKKI